VAINDLERLRESRHDLSDSLRELRKVAKTLILIVFLFRIYFRRCPLTAAGFVYAINQNSIGVIAIGAREFILIITRIITRIVVNLNWVLSIYANSTSNASGCPA